MRRCGEGGWGFTRQSHRTFETIPKLCIHPSPPGKDHIEPPESQTARKAPPDTTATQIDSPSRPLSTWLPYTWRAASNSTAQLNHGDLICTNSTDVSPCPACLDVFLFCRCTPQGFYPNKTSSIGVYPASNMALCSNRKRSSRTPCYSSLEPRS